MIRTSEQLSQTEKLLSNFRSSLKDHRSKHPKSCPGDMSYLIEQGLLGQISDLHFQVEAYNALEKGKSVRLRRLTDIGQVLAAARIIKKLTQADLANKLEMRQQQIQRYEAADYRGIAIERIDKVIEALGIDFHLS